MTQENINAGDYFVVGNEGDLPPLNVDQFTLHLGADPSNEAVVVDAGEEHQ